MAKTLFFRILQFPLILAVIYLVTFLLCWVAPGSPFENPEGKKLDPIAMEALKKRFHADSTLRFLTYYPREIILHGDFGPSLQQKEWSVNDILKSALPISVTLGLFALTIASLAGVTMGTYSAVRVGGFTDWAGLTLTLVGISLPSFVSAAVLLLIFSGELKWFPVGGWGGFSTMVLPAIALSLAPMAYIVRLMRASMLDVLGADYVRTARAKGLSRPMVILKHCLRNAFLPVLSFLGPAAADTLTGSFVVEKVFNIPGLGQQFVNSVLNRDQTLILGTVMVYSALLLFFNLLVDIGYVFIDPRIELGEQIMTVIAAMPPEPMDAPSEPSDHPARRALKSPRIVVGGGILLAIGSLCLLTLFFTLNPNSSFYYDHQIPQLARAAPASVPSQWFGMDTLGRSLLGRCLLGGTISLGIGLAAAVIAMALGVTVGLLAGYRGGLTDAVLMRFVDILYGLPSILMVILFKIAFEPALARWIGPAAANLVVLFGAIGLVSWLTMSRVVRGQVLSVRSQPFIEACRAMGIGELRIYLRHIMPNLIGPIIVYATLTVPVAILSESFLSFLGVGISPPMPTWGSLAADGLLQALNPLNHRWWMLFFPCLLLALTLLSLNFLGDGLRDVFDPKRESKKI